MIFPKRPQRFVQQFSPRVEPVAEIKGTRLSLVIISNFIIPLNKRFLLKVIFFDYLSNNVLTGNSTQWCFFSMVSKRKHHHKPAKAVFKPKRLPES
jgi:hypothetical protein